MQKAYMIWEMEATLPNLFLADGKRAAVITCTDTASRRVMSHVVDAESGEAVVECLREAIKAWGTPREVVTDNSKVFSSCYVSRVLQYAGITHTRKSPFMPTVGEGR